MSHRSYKSRYYNDNVKFKIIRKNNKGEIHCENNPAIEYEDGSKEWYNNGKLHREDGPAIDYSNEIKEWYVNGKKHRIDGPAMIFFGTKEWYNNGIRHRSDGPAIELSNGNKYWYINGQKHRVDGPAVEYQDGSKKWYINGNNISQDYFNALMCIKRFREKCKKIPIKNWYRLYLITKTEAFCKWYYNPENGGGKIHKRKMLSYYN